jgi:hypothetical protein
MIPSPFTQESLAREQRHALDAARTLISSGPAHVAALRDEAACEPDGVERIEPASQPEIRYALQFLTYAYGVPFRLVALQQELTDVFGFEGVFDDEFVGRWRTLSEPERAAFSQSFREYRRMQALGNQFGAAEKDIESTSPLEDQASRFVAAHLDGLDDWQETLRTEAGAVSRTAAEIFAAPASDHLQTGAPGDDEAQEASGPILLEGLAGRDRTDVSSVWESLAPIDDLARIVLDELCAHELAAAQGRFLGRVRWLLGLPNQQRVAVALRTSGKKRREIARAMGISEESVKTHLSRADDDWESLTETQKTGNRGKSPRKRRSRNEEGAKSG